MKNVKILIIAAITSILTISLILYAKEEAKKVKEVAELKKSKNITKPEKIKEIQEIILKPNYISMVVFPSNYNIVDIVTEKGLKFKTEKNILFITKEDKINDENINLTLKDKEKTRVVKLILKNETETEKWIGTYEINLKD